MTQKFYAWVEYLGNRDATLAKLGLFAIGLIVAWELLRFMPPSWAARLRPLYMVGFGVMMLATAVLIYFGGQQ